jgi:hypothetical protein
MKKPLGIAGRGLRIVHEHAAAATLAERKARRAIRSPK